jgi:hypothetical protein
MALREMDEGGGVYEVVDLPHRDDFDRIWFTIPEKKRNAIEAEINGRLDILINTPDPNWGSITNTSIEGGKANPVTGIRGDWRGTVFQPIYEAFGGDDNDDAEEYAGMFFGNVWKKAIIERDERWIGIRSDPTFPQRGITLQGKTYFLDSNQ